MQTLARQIPVFLLTWQISYEYRRDRHHYTRHHLCHRLGEAPRNEVDSRYQYISYGFELTLSQRFDEKRQISRLIEAFIAKSNAAQRRGRAGRVQSGLCFHLFSRARQELVRVRSYAYVQITDGTHRWPTIRYLR